MHAKMIRHILALAVASWASGLASPVASRADLTVHSGWDLFMTIPPTDFMGVQYVGVPINTFDFGLGPIPVGRTDTIVHRLATATVPGPVPPSQSATTPIRMEALQLASKDPISFGGGPLGTYYITLQSERGGPASLGNMTISFDSQVNEPLTTPHGTFDSFLDVYFDVRFGSLSGPIVASDHLPLTSTDVDWVHIAPDGALTIPGVNYLLDGTDISQDFWPSAFTEFHPLLGQHTVTTVPEPSSAALAAVVVAVGGWMVRLKRSCKTRHTAGQA